MAPIIIRFETEKTSGPFRASSAIAEAIVEKVMEDPTLDLEGSEYEVIHGEHVG